MDLFINTIIINKVIVRANKFQKKNAVIGGEISSRVKCNILIEFIWNIRTGFIDRDGCETNETMTSSFETSILATSLANCEELRQSNRYNSGSVYKCIYSYIRAFFIIC